jgi:hypothetical protein
MNIKITKLGARNQMVCDKKDGTKTIIDIGPTLPAHDLAHFVVENTLQMKQGFYGNIWQGYTFAQLNDKHVIKTLPAESMYAEVITRALQTLASGACRQDDFLYMLEMELQGQTLPYNLSPTVIAQMQQHYEQLLQKWQENETIHLIFDILL